MPIYLFLLLLDCLAEDSPLIITFSGLLSLIFKFGLFAYQLGYHLLQVNRKLTQNSINS